MKLKLCGLRRPEDIAMANDAAPDYIGFIFAPSPRRVTPEYAAELGKSLKKGIKKVGVFVNEPTENIIKIALAAGLDVIQLHGDEDESCISALRKCFGGEIWKAVQVQNVNDIRSAEALSADMLLYDSFSPLARGGTGKRLNLSVLTSAEPKRPYFLAGGINAENIGEILSAVSPYGIDISGGFETDGFKDRKKLENFLNAFRKDENI